MAFKTTCAKPGCSVAIPHGQAHCHLHKKSEAERKLADDRQRRRWSEASPEKREASRLYSTARWHRLRLSILNDEPLCRHCTEQGLVVPATVVDHVRRHNNDPNLFYDYGNLQSLCKSCHDVKTNTVDREQRLIDWADRDNGR